MGIKTDISAIIKNIEKSKRDIKKASAVAQAELVKVLFSEMERKYIVPGKNVDGKQYNPSSNANIPKMTRVRTKSGIIKRFTKAFFFSAKQVVSRTGTLLASVKMLTQISWSIGESKTATTEDYKVEYKPGSVTISTVSDKARMMEIKKAAGGSKPRRGIIMKTFSAGIRAYNKQLAKMWAKVGK